MHVPVMLDEVVGALVNGEAKLFFDGTLGGGGHAEAILNAAGPDSTLIGIDRDEGALRKTGERLQAFGDRIRLHHANFEAMKNVVNSEGFEGVDGVLMDIGYSSNQVDDPERGFSFSDDGPLDMRMDRSEPLTAAAILNSYEESDLADMIYQYGEERASRRIARAIVRRRSTEPFERTNDLADIAGRAAGGRKGRIHPATKTFQALRIEVNRELECLKEGLKQGTSLLNPGGRMAVISFHSLEDRIVKYFFRELAKEEGGSKSFTIITRKPLIAGESELDKNPRARSAKLRVIERQD
jgi:16S rRNA (cytosine1402-N4)-methyltransferase